MRRGHWWVRSPGGPLIITRPGSSDTDTPAGISIGFFPIRLIQLPHKTDDFAADAFAFGGLARDDPPGGRHDRRAHSAENARQAILASVHTAARLGDALQVGDDALPAGAVLELDDEHVVALARAHREALDVALLLEQPCDLDLLTR